MPVYVLLSPYQIVNQFIFLGAYFFIMHLDICYVYLKKLKQLVIWDGGVSSS